jgi:putative flavoprotein involved in K+ transport
MEATMNTDREREGVEHFDTVVVGGGQSGLAMGFHLKRRGEAFVILDANDRVGDAWRQRWDSLRLFTPTWCSALPGMRFPGKRRVAPTKDEMADYLEAYVAQFELPVRGGTRVDALRVEGDGFVVTAGEWRCTAAQVVVATGAFSTAWRPLFASDVDPRILQLHSSEYRNPDQLRPGGVLVVGAGNSGCDIALDVAAEHPTWLSGRHPGHVPFRIEGRVTRQLVHVVRFMGHHVLTLGTPIGRTVIPKLAQSGDPVIRIKPNDIVAAGIEQVPRVTGVVDGLPVLEDGRPLSVSNVVWCTGFRRSFPWIDIAVFAPDGSPIHDRGVVVGHPGLYFLGLPFQYAATSDLLTGVGRDARRLARHIAKRHASSGKEDRQASDLVTA